MKNKRIGIVYDTSVPGRGGHGTHLAFKGLPGADVVALADSNHANLEARLADVEAKRHYDSWLELLDKEKLDIIDVCSRLPGDHFDVICCLYKWHHWMDWIGRTTYVPYCGWSEQ